MFAEHWVIYTVLIVFILGWFIRPTRSLYGYVTAQLLTNNNWLCLAGYVVAILLTINAIHVGLGEPIFMMKNREVVQPAINSAIEMDNKNESKVQKEVGYILFGDDDSIKLSKAESVNADVDTGYPSWWHFLSAVLMWIIAIVYTPFALREEVAEAIKTIIERAVAGGKNLTGGSSGDVSHGSTGSVFKDFFKYMSIDLLMEIGMNVFKRIKNSGAI